MFSIYESVGVIGHIAFFAHMELAYQPVLLRIRRAGECENPALTLLVKRRM